MIQVTRLTLAQAEALSRSAPFRDSPVRLDSATHSRSPCSRWSYLPGPATLILQCRDDVATLRSARSTERAWSDPLDALAWLSTQTTANVGDGPPFKTGWIGYLSYDLGRKFESLPLRARDDLQLPLFTFTYHDRVIAIDHHEGVAYECRADSDDETLKIAGDYATAASPVTPTVSRSAYESAVGRAIDYIRAGDIFQVNLSQRFTAGLPVHPREVYDRLRRTHPAWFGAFLDYGDHALLSNSPELFLRITPDGQITTRPIKGTRPRRAGMEEQLHRSEKDQAELNMIIDLERNDLGRICRTGTVKVTEPRAIEAHPTVYHGAATIEGQLKAGTTFLDVLGATFPGGSITGAPKIRAMEIIEELEPTRRGPYCGAIGFLSADGHAQFSIAIRTMIAKGNQIHFSVGGGVVADSTPAGEYEETLVKATAMLDVLQPR